MTCYMTKVAMCTSIWEFDMLFFILRQFQKFCMSESNFLPIFIRGSYLILNLWRGKTVYINVHMYLIYIHKARFYKISLISIYVGT